MTTPSRSFLIAAVASLLLALAPLNSKIAGALWGLGFFAAAIFASTRRPWPPADSIDRAARLWLLCALIAWFAWAAVMAIWSELFAPKSAELNAGLRLAVGALTALWLVRVMRGPEASSERFLSWIPASIAVACLVSLYIPFTQTRDHYPSNAIPWAAAIAIWSCLSAAWALDRNLARWLRFLCGLGALAGTVATLASQSRGAYTVLGWLLVLIGFAWLRSSFSPWVKRTAVVGVIAAFVVGLGLAVSAQSDPLRLRLAAREAQEALNTGNYNTSVGARVYLLSLGWKTFLSSPWVGVGANQRLSLIKNAGAGGPPSSIAALEVVRSVGHAHNAYMHHAMDGGLLGLGGFLAILIGLVMAGIILYRIQPVLGLQMFGIAFMHATSNLSNVNLAHNYYALTLALGSTAVLIQARLLAPKRPGVQ
jgi:O-antigen ligase